VSNPFAEYKKVVRAKTAAAVSGGKTEIDLIIEFANAVKLYKTEGETCEYGYFDGDQWMPNQTTKLEASAGVYRKFALRISVTAGNGVTIEHTHLDFMAKMNDTFRATLHSLDLSANATECSESLSFADDSVVRIQRELQLFDRAFRHKYRF
jgi:hypothetical protein